MPDIYDLARVSVGTLFSDVVSADRFKKWRAGVVVSVADKLSQYAFGEIFWRKSLGRPNTTKLSEAITIEAWQDEEAHDRPDHWTPFRGPRYPAWWDGKDDGEYWRVSYMVPNLAEGLSVGLPNDTEPPHIAYTHIVPQLKLDVPWQIPGSRFGIGNTGLRTLEPPGVAFVKPKTSVHFSFEVVLKSLFVSP